MLDVRRAPASDHPMALLALASTLLTVVDPRRKDPLQDGDDEAGLSREELLQSLVHVDQPGTSALLGAMVALRDDEVERRRITRSSKAATAGCPGGWRRWGRPRPTGRSR